MTRASRGAINMHPLSWGGGGHKRKDPDTDKKLERTSAEVQYFVHRCHVQAIFKM